MRYSSAGTAFAPLVCCMYHCSPFFTWVQPGPHFTPGAARLLAEALKEGKEKVASPTFATIGAVRFLRPKPPEAVAVATGAVDAVLPAAVPAPAAGRETL